MAKLGNITTIITAVMITLTTRFVLIFINDTSIVFFPVCEQTSRLFSGNFELSILRQGAPPIAAIGNPPISDFIITTERSNGLFFDQTVVFRYQIENMCFFAPFIACILNIPRDSCAASAFHYNGDRYK